MKRTCSLAIIVVILLASISPAMAWNDGRHDNYRGHDNYRQNQHYNQDHRQHNRNEYGMMTERDWVALGVRVGLPIFMNIITAPPRGYSSPSPGYYGNNPGIQGAYQRGIADRNYEIQQQMEREAYERGRYYGR